jgi:hypothetical protein
MGYSNSKHHACIGLRHLRRNHAVTYHSWYRVDGHVRSQRERRNAEHRLRRNQLWKSRESVSTTSIYKMIHHDTQDVFESVPFRYATISQTSNHFLFYRRGKRIRIPSQPDRTFAALRSIDDDKGRNIFGSQTFWVTRPWANETKSRSDRSMRYVWLNGFASRQSSQKNLIHKQEPAGLHWSGYCTYCQNVLILVRIEDEL